MRAEDIVEFAGKYKVCQSLIDKLKVNLQKKLVILQMLSGQAPESYVENYSVLALFQEFPVKETDLAVPWLSPSEKLASCKTFFLTFDICSTYESYFLKQK